LMILADLNQGVHFIFLNKTLLILVF